MPEDWGALFDSYGVKTVSYNDKAKSAYVPSEEQKQVLQHAGLEPDDGTPTRPRSIRVLGDASRQNVTASFYHARGHPKRERRLGREFVSAWLDQDDELLMGVVDNELFVAKIQDPASHSRIRDDLAQAIQSAGAVDGKLTPRLDDGRPLKAAFSVSGVTPDFRVIIECGEGRNRTGYPQALELLLVRLAEAGAELVAAEVVSSVAKRRNIDEALDTAVRPAPFDLPLKLSVEVADELRKALGRAGAAIGRPPGTSGNTTKRLALDVRIRPPGIGRLADLTRLLVHGAGGVDEDGEGLSGLLDETDRRNLALADSEEALEALRKKYENAAPVVRHQLSAGIERGPVGRWVKQANGYRCSVCEGLGLQSEGFLKRGGGRYVEAHHVMPVSTLTIGALGPQNIICVCANHHRQIHYGCMEIQALDDRFIISLEGQTIEVKRISFSACSLG